MTRKLIITLCVDAYAPAITALTFPLMRSYARKIGADFAVIDSRQFAEWPAPCEKFQVYDRSRDYDFTLFLDADALIHPDCPDLSTHLPRDTVLHHSVDRSTIRFASDAYFARDGRFCAPGNWMTAAWDWCRDIWEPPAVGTLGDVVSRITPTVAEINAGITRSHLADDYLVARNRARYGLKVMTFFEMCNSLGIEPRFFWHQYTIPESEKVAQMRDVLTQWGITIPCSESTSRSEIETCTAPSPA